MESSNAELIYDDMSQKIIDAATEMVTADGAGSLNVRRILKHLNISNRVFYNRFHNIEEVLDIICRNASLKVREILSSPIDETRDFFEQIMQILEKTMIISYNTRMKFAHYVFENDSNTNTNYEWWINEIKKILEYAMKHNYIKKVDLDMASYSIWCFIRGFNADVIGRNLSMEEALKVSRYGFGFIIDGLRK